MTKLDFMNKIRSRLAGLPEADVQKVLNYFEEMIDDRVEEGLSEEEAVEAIGSADELLRELLDELPEAAAPEKASEGPKQDAAGAAAEDPLTRMGSAIGDMLQPVEQFLNQLRQGFNSDDGQEHTAEAPAGEAAEPAPGAAPEPNGVQRAGGSELFSHLDIDAPACDVTIRPSDDGDWHVTCSGAVNQIMHAAVTEGVLTVTFTNADVANAMSGFPKLAKFLGKLAANIVINGGDVKLDVYLPVRRYEDLKISTAGGDILVPEGFTFDDVTLNTASGDIRMRAEIAGDLTASTVSGDLDWSGIAGGTAELRTVSGDLRCAAVSVGGRMEAVTVSGDMHIRESDCRGASFSSTSGDIHLIGVLVNGRVLMKTISGDIRFDECDGLQMEVITTSGSITGSLVTPKAMTAKSISGSVVVPESGVGGSCRLQSVSGDIRVTL